MSNPNDFNNIPFEAAADRVFSDTIADFVGTVATSLAILVSASRNYIGVAIASSGPAAGLSK